RSRFKKDLEEYWKGIIQECEIVKLKKWHIQPELNSISEDDSGIDFSKDFYEGRDTSIEDNSSTSRVADVLGSQRKISRKRKNVTPTPARNIIFRILTKLIIMLVLCLKSVIEINL
ncbi:10682_t:CDS:2, partial [Funneliformis caledonium]